MWGRKCPRGSRSQPAAILRGRAVRRDRIHAIELAGDSELPETGWQVVRRNHAAGISAAEARVAQPAKRQTDTFRKERPNLSWRLHSLIRRERRMGAKLAGSSLSFQQTPPKNRLSIYRQIRRGHHLRNAAFLVTEGEAGRDRGFRGNCQKPDKTFVRFCGGIWAGDRTHVSGSSQLCFHRQSYFAGSCKAACQLRPSSPRSNKP